MNIAESQKLLDLVNALSTRIESLESRLHLIESEAAQRQSADTPRGQEKHRSINGSR